MPKCITLLSLFSSFRAPRFGSTDMGWTLQLIFPSQNPKTKYVCNTCDILPALLCLQCRNVTWLWFYRCLFLMWNVQTNCQFMTLYFKLAIYVFHRVSSDKCGYSGLPQVYAAYKSRQSRKGHANIFCRADFSQNTERPWNEKSTPLLCFKMGKLLAFEKYPFPIWAEAASPSSPNPSPALPLASC